MKKIISKLGIDSAFLISFILLCSVFTSEYAFSGRSFNKKENIKVIQDSKDPSIIYIKFLFYDYSNPIHPEHSFMKDIEFKYLEEGNEKYQTFICGKTPIQDSNDAVKFMTIGQEFKTKGTVIFPKCYKYDKRNRRVWMEMKTEQYQSGHISRTSNAAYMSIKYILPKDGKAIQEIAFECYWKNHDNQKTDYFEKYYTLDDLKPSSNAMKNAPSVVKSEISDNVKVTGKTDVINITGADPGNDIKVYTVSGVEVKSVVANDDVVDIKLPKNQMYIVKTGQTSYKVAL